MVVILAFSMVAVAYAKAPAGKGGGKPVPQAAVPPAGTVTVRIFVWSQSNFNDPLGNGGLPDCYVEWDNYWGTDPAFFADSGTTDALGFFDLHAYPGYHRLYLQRKNFRSSVVGVVVGDTDPFWVVVKMYPDSSWYNPF
jgi:hypothetical protein